MITKDQVLQLIRMKGPVIPANISKEINQNLLVSSAILAELSSKKDVKVSNLKIGGSPLYYLDGQESRLQEFSNRLNPEERVAYNLLREKRILMDKDLVPRTRVALRLIKDFAVPLQVSFNDREELFWKWYLTSNSDVERLVKERLGLIEEEAKKESVVQKPVPQPLKSIPKPIPQTDVQKTEPPRSIEKPEKKPVITKPKLLVQEKSVEPQQTFSSDAETLFIDSATAGFLKLIKNYFADNKIKVKYFTMVKKGLESDFIIAIPSAFGDLTYYCKAKSKKRLNEADISAAYIQSQIKKLPGILLSQGELTKKASELIERDLKGFYFKRI